MVTPPGPPRCRSPPPIHRPSLPLPPPPEQVDFLGAVQCCNHASIVGRVCVILQLRSRADPTPGVRRLTPTTAIFTAACQPVPGVHGGNGWSSLFDRRSLPVVRGHEIHQRSTLQARCPGCDPFGIDRPVDSPGRLPTWLPRPGSGQGFTEGGVAKVLTWIIALIIIVAIIVYLIIRHYRNRDSSGPPTGGGYIGM